MNKKIKRLEKIRLIKRGTHNEAFEKGFQETLRYKEQSGETNAPAIYATANGYKLGNWQRLQRSNYKKGKLAPERVKRLERIGFKWTIKKGRLK